ncbi:MAG: acylneuraminate cytidylyltransferase family protein [Thaumarchaeota archaeon]|nr:MAG: acylneuraminate cytidylyltransferase family protein [Nitrososphaerota archaeon]
MPKRQLNFLSIIPARSGSTQVKNKNIRLLGDKPLIYYTIRESLKSNVSRTIVSTDDSQIAILAKKFGAEVPFLRPKIYATHKSSSISVILNCLDYLKKTENYFPDYVVFLQPTSPFRQFTDINNGIRKIMNSNATSLVGIVEVTQHPFWMFKKGKKDKLGEFIRLRKKPLRRQELSKLYYINDALFISKGQYYERISHHKPLFDTTDLIGLEMNYPNSFDINTEMDFHIANLLLKSVNTRK